MQTTPDTTIKKYKFTIVYATVTEVVEAKNKEEARMKLIGKYPADACIDDGVEIVHWPF